MKDERLEAEKAEFIQSVKALYIPLSLFLACVIMAAGVFLIYNLEPTGWAFVAVSGAIMASAFFALIRFQNRLRASGVLPIAALDDEVLSPFEPDSINPQHKEFKQFSNAAQSREFELKN
ncbi:MAG TPA: hypothetical protein V6C97_35395 [Oculatellaceae cyanobacterium]